MTRLGVCLALCAACASWTPRASAHTSLGEYVQHRYTLAVTATNIDLTLALTFNGSPAKSERAAMDTDKNGTISADELRAYGARLEKAADPLRLFAEKIAIPLAALYTPAVDLEGDRAVGPHPFIVTLKFFARTPDALRPGAAMRIESALQLAAPALVALEVRGDAAPPITIEPNHGDTLPPSKDPQRTFEVTCPRFNASGEGAAPHPAAPSKNDAQSQQHERSTKPVHGEHTP